MARRGATDVPLAVVPAEAMRATSMGPTGVEVGAAPVMGPLETQGQYSPRDIATAAPKTTSLSPGAGHGSSDVGSAPRPGMVDGEDRLTNDDGEIACRVIPIDELSTVHV
ncbi:hypothetical protein HaLaN_08323 [Haematococcus lacustris]|uniref:Uncharacterized protein n=1 Tax=Haematococcus lacustris TaxID=44745 RepID=A0A699YYT9_HAELA|nr:hypothetical protein HaLaN_08323 [Haematococcus lacustris]